MNCNDCKKYENKCQPPDCFHFEPNENKMEFFNGSSNYIKTYDHMLSEKEREDEYNKMEKVQMTEEQADQIYDAFLYKASNEIGRQQFKNALKSNGFIKKIRASNFGR